MRSALLCLVLLACSGGDDGAKQAWTRVHLDDPAAMLAVWGTSASDVWVVGARTELSGGPTIYRYDGSTWTKVDSQQTSLDLWWVFGFPGGDVFFGGSGGTILRYRNGAFEKMTTPRNVGTIFGIWGTAPNDVWAVGTAVAAGAIVWHYDGNTWSEATVPAGVPSTVFKVAGRAANDVWMSAASGAALHGDGGALTLASTGAAGPLFSVAVTSSMVYAVGGNSGQGEIVESTGDGTWTPVAVSNPSRWRGVASGPDDVVYVVGETGTVARKVGATWEEVAQDLHFGNFHAVWIDPDGGVWGVGGDFDRPDPRAGFILHYGTKAPEEVAP